MSKFAAETYHHFSVKFRKSVKELPLARRPITVAKTTLGTTLRLLGGVQGPHFNNQAEFSQCPKKRVSCLPPREILQGRSKILTKIPKYACSKFLHNSFLYVRRTGTISRRAVGLISPLWAPRHCKQVDPPFAVLVSPKGRNHYPIDALTRR